MRSFFLSAIIAGLLGLLLGNYHFIKERLAVQGTSVYNWCALPDGFLCLW